MDIQDAQREVRSVYIGGFWGQLVSSVIWRVSAMRGTGHSQSVYPDRRHRRIFHLSAHANAAAFVGPPRVREQRNSFNSLGMQVAFVLPFSMLLLVPVGHYDLNLFFPALMVLLGAHYLPFATLYGCVCSCSLGEF
jgi:hypothetical protein